MTEEAPNGQQQNPPAAPAFTPPATQADLDRIIGERVARERAKYGDYGDLKAKAAKFDEVEAASKSELQKAIERAEAAEKKATEFESRQQITAWAKQVSEKTGVPADALRGSTLEELEAHAAQVKALIPEAPKGARAPYVPGEGKAPSGNLGGPAAEFADYIAAQLRH
ncbi:MAG: hypothetical protein QM695_15865 [Micropruina sp.]